MKEGELLINKTLEESESQKDRREIDNLKSLNVISFVEKQLKKAMSKDTLRNSIIAKLNSKINPNSDEEEELTSVELIKLLEILEKSDNDLTSVILNSANEFKSDKSRQEESERLDISVDDMNAIKKLNKLLKYTSIIDKAEGNHTP